MPETNKSKKFLNVESNYSSKNYSQKMLEYQKRKEIESEMERGDSEFSRMKECTFKPEINERIEAEITPIADQIVKGIDFVRRKREMIMKMKEDRAEREKEVFDYVSKYDNNPAHKSYTVPAPFNLSKVRVFYS